MTEEVKSATTADITPNEAAITALKAALAYADALTDLDLVLWVDAGKPRHVDDPRVRRLYDMRNALFTEQIPSIEVFVGMPLRDVGTPHLAHDLMSQVSQGDGWQDTVGASTRE